MCKDSPLCADMKVELMYSVVELSVNKAAFDCRSLENPCYFFFLVSNDPKYLHEKHLWKVCDVFGINLKKNFTFLCLDWGTWLKDKTVFTKMLPNTAREPCSYSSNAFPKTVFQRITEIPSWSEYLKEFCSDIERFFVGNLLFLVSAITWKRTLTDISWSSPSPQSTSV